MSLTEVFNNTLEENCLQFYIYPFKCQFSIFGFKSIKLLWIQFHAVCWILNFTQIFIQTSHQKICCKSLRAFLIKEFQLVLLFSSIVSSTNILQNTIKYTLFDLTSAVIPVYVIATENHFPLLFKRFGIDDEKWMMTKTIIFHTHMTVCLLQMWHRTAANASPSTVSNIQLINWIWLWNALTFLLVSTSQIKTVDIHTSILPVHTLILHFSSHLL